MALRQQWFFLTDTATGDGSNYFLIPSDCNCVWVTMIGAGAGGGYGQSGSPNAGAAGGCSCLPILRVPIAVKPNGVLTVVVARGAIGGSNTKYNYFNRTGGGVWSAASENEDGASSHLSSVITGDILDPGFAGAHACAPFFNSGYAGDTAPQYKVASLGYQYVSPPQTNSEFNLPTKNWVGQVPFNWIGACVAGENGVAIQATQTGVGKVGLSMGNDKQPGAEGTWGPSDFGAAGTFSSGCFAAGDGGVLGANGVGGGNIFGYGGAAGIPFVNRGAGGDGQGYGSGGGGGCYNAPGGNGADGFVLLEY